MIRFVPLVSSYRKPNLAGNSMQCWKKRVCFLVFFLSLSVFSWQVSIFGQSSKLQDTQEISGVWDCHLQSPGGELPFQLVIRQDLSGYLVDQKLVKIPNVTYQDKNLTVDFSHFNSKIAATWNPKTSQFEGTWKKIRGKDRVGKMNFSAKRNARNEYELKPKITSAMKPFFGRWEVKFSSSDDPAVFEFANTKADRKFSTFLTTTGDYRYLRQRVDDKGILWMSCFDGAHAFLFRGEANPDGTLAGKFWSGNSWKESWTAKSNPNAKLPDAFLQTKINRKVNIDSFQFPNLGGKMMSLNDPSFQGKARIVYVFGSWCPNCHDAADYFKLLQKKYGKEGLKILGLAFEMTGDFDRDSRQVKTYVQRHTVNYPILVAGLADKKLASKAIPFLDKVRSYPTTIFLDRNGKVVKVHTGFSGPATGKAYGNLKEDFEKTIERMLR